MRLKRRLIFLVFELERIQIGNKKRLKTVNKQSGTFSRRTVLYKLQDHILKVSC